MSPYVSVAGVATQPTPAVKAVSCRGVNTRGATLVLRVIVPALAMARTLTGVS